MTDAVTELIPHRPPFLFVDAIVARTGPHEVILELAANAAIPVVNGLSIREHPCQALADYLTILEHRGTLDGLVLAFVGDGNNVYHSLALLGATLGAEVRLAHPPGYAPNPAIVEQAGEIGRASGGRLELDVLRGRGASRLRGQVESLQQKRVDRDQEAGPGHRQRGHLRAEHQA